jgi:hypothetical protein
MDKMDSRTHGVLDYLTVGFLLMLPRALRWNKPITTTFTAAALGTLGYSLLTRYELGIIRKIPFRTHLVLDALNGAFFCMAPLLFRKHHPTVQAAMVGIGLFEIVASVSTEDDTEQVEEFKFEQYEGALREYSPI